MSRVEFYERLVGEQRGHSPKNAEWRSEWRWRVKADNGEIVASGEGHTSRGDAERAFITAVAATKEAYREFVQ